MLNKESQGTRLNGKSGLANNSVILSFEENSNLHGISFEGIKFLSPVENCFFMPESILSELDIADFPTSVTIYPYECIEDFQVMFSGRQIGIKNNGDGMVTVVIEACLNSYELTDGIGVEAFQAIKKDLVLEQGHLQAVIHDYNFTGEAVHLHYSIILPTDKFKNIIESAKAIDSDLDAHILMAVPDTLQLTRKALNQPKANKVGKK